MSRASEDYYERFVAYLRDRGRGSFDAAGGTFVIAGLGGWSAAAPLRLHLTAAELGEYLEALAPHAVGAFSDVDDDTEQAWRLFLLHLNEAVQASEDGDTRLYLHPPSGIRTGPG
jgi:hypothetical protein